MGNLDFAAEPTFSWYVVLLLLSGIMMVPLAAIGRGQSAGQRALTALVGAGLLGYGIYLAFIFTGGTYHIFFYVFILPVLMLIRFVQAVVGKQKA